MQRKLILNAVGIIGCAAAAGGCTPSVSVSDLARPNYGRNPHPIVLLDPPYVINGQSGLSFSQAPCLPSNYRCTPQAQVQWTENAFR